MIAVMDGSRSITAHDLVQIATHSVFVWHMSLLPCMSHLARVLTPSVDAAQADRDILVHGLCERRFCRGGVVNPVQVDMMPDANSRVGMGRVWDTTAAWARASVKYRLEPSRSGSFPQSK